MSAREKALSLICENERRHIEATHEESIMDSFGKNVFNEQIQRKGLSEEHFNKLQGVIKRGEKLDRPLADAVANSMKKWALEKGATHFCHWFQPLTDLTAEKHDALFAPNNEGSAILSFSGNELIRGEPDASSFPSGGLRTTFEARGYTAWDPSSPAFILGRTLMIPTIFISYLGEALDKKIPLLRSMDALNNEALRVLRLFGDSETKRVFPTVGAEQEYFLIDKHYYYLRPDLLLCGRTLFGAKPPKGQELEDQYLGTIPERILQVMEEAEREMRYLGIPVQTRHNEVAPSQYELTIHYQSANLAVDHHMIAMETLKRVASKYKMVCLLHEKPFAHINGSGKHNNWSLATDLGKNLLEPGQTPHANAQFLLFCAAVIRAIYRNASFLWASLASTGNEHRLGQHEAPPGIMSVFLGEQLFDIFQRIKQGAQGGKKTEGELKLGMAMLPRLPRHSSDRNRTSPFAFTGNKFELRAVGSLANIAGPNTILNTIVADSLHYFANELEKASKENFNEVLQKLLAKSVQEFEPVLFEGDNYDEKWHKEALKRGLPNITNAVDAFGYYMTEEAITLVTKYNVYSKRELESRKEIELSKYVKKIKIEAETTSMIAHTQIIPACFSYAQQIGGVLKFMDGPEVQLFKELSKCISHLYKALLSLDEMLEKMPHEVGFQPFYVRDHILPGMQGVRTWVDRLEGIIPDNLWPLPKYFEMLFIR